MTEGHLEECRSVPAAENCPEVADMPGMEHIFIQVCADGCPVLERTLEWGRQLAKERGW